MNVARSTSLVCAMAIVAACVAQTEVTKLYDNPDRPVRGYERLLVVSPSSDIGFRRRLEELITKNLTAADIPAIAAYTETGLKTDLLQDEIDAAARNVDADAILTTHIASVDTHVHADTVPVESLRACGAALPGDYSLYDDSRVKEPDSVELAHTVVVVSNLYDASDGERLWTIQSTCFDNSSMDEVLQEEAAAIVKQLRIDKLAG